MTMPILQAVLALAQFVPAVSKLIGGSKIDAISKKIIDIAKAVTNAQNETDAVEKLKADKQLMTIFQKALIDSEREIELALIKDKENARTRDIAIINSGKRNKRADIMVIAAAVGLIVCLLCLIFYQNDLPGEAVGIISTIAGIFGSCLKDAYNFEFGSSRGSKEKDFTVASIINKNS
ncbi:MAG: hypothetical protein LBU35_01075 [Holosporales bacterium]|jgi:hypothetical protein|nr:hypothetical protein [Holosporales bacterium]